MEDSISRGFMAVFAVSGGVVFIAMQAHKRLSSDFINRIELQINNSTGGLKDVKKRQKKKVRFADDVVAEKAHTEKNPAAVSGRSNGENLEAMPQNWQVLYRGILRNRNIY